MYSIWHTSHCGSTYLACLLSESIPTYSEPTWCKEDKIIEKPNCLVKYPSYEGYKVIKHGGKKVFLYRTLYSDLLKNAIKPSGIGHSVYENFFNHPFKPALLEKYDKAVRNCTGLLHQTTTRAYIWLNYVKYMNEAKDIIFVNSQDLFNDPNNVCRRICAFFEIEYVPVQANYYDLNTTLNNCDDIIDLNKLDKSKVFVEPYDVQNGKLIRWVNDFLEESPRIKHMAY